MGGGGGYARDFSGYRFMATGAPILNFGGVAVFYHGAGNFALEALCLHGPNVSRFQIETGQQRWYSVLIAPKDASTL